LLGLRIHKHLGEEEKANFLKGKLCVQKPQNEHGMYLQVAWAVKHWSKNE
jgi:hypothetical protein